MYTNTEGLGGGRVDSPGHQKRPVEATVVFRQSIAFCRAQGTSDWNPCLALRVVKLLILQRLKPFLLLMSRGDLSLSRVLFVFYLFNSR